MASNLIILFVLQASLVEVFLSAACSNNCWFVLNDPSGDESRGKDFSIPIDPPKVVTGIITVDAHFTMEKDVVTHDILKFVKIEHPFSEFAHPLEIQISAKGDLNQVVAWGVSTSEDDFGNLHKEKIGPTLFANPHGPITPIFADYNIDIQISDLNITHENCYKFYIGTPGQSEVWAFYYGSQSMWQEYSDKRLNSSIRIEDNDPKNLTTYDSISVCSTPQPTLCDTEDSITIDAVLGATYTLTCSGSGAPYLASEWRKNTYRETNETHLEFHDNNSLDTADNSIESALAISSFTIDHIGTWKCRIFNKNFGNSVEKDYEFKYTKNIELLVAPKDDHVYDSMDESAITWVVEGWPFNDVMLTCNEDHGIQIVKDATEFYAHTPPRLSITLLFTETTADYINCTLLNGNAVLHAVNITRVGYRCSIGEYGVEKHCHVCPQGQTSQGGSTTCYSATNSCHKHQYGVGKDCRKCPFGTITLGLAVKVQDCQNVSYEYRGQCDPGEYGLQGRCDTCPIGTTSEKGAVKVYECFPDASYCEPGYWGVGNDCTECPVNKTSVGNALKIQECTFLVSYCATGEYGVESGCTVCPGGMTSHPRTHVHEGCFRNGSGVNYTTIAIAVLSCLLLLVIAVCGRAMKLNSKMRMRSKHDFAKDGSTYCPMKNILEQPMLMKDGIGDLSQVSIRPNDRTAIRPRCQSMPACRSIVEDPNDEISESEISFVPSNSLNISTEGEDPDDEISFIPSNSLNISTEAVNAKGTLRMKDISPFTQENKATNSFFRIPPRKSLEKEQTEPENKATFRSY